ncbi:membrane-associated protein [Paraburkholderia sp. Clong3]|uniref:VTT domain-containing protein n=1 Tax=unclassified Paraburkholderia TaxID=2615204 RepID=UPI0016151E15|nr:MULTISPECIES: VTT domain-containing protein [unclassified Paraburkholderia]MBB5461972.1 membrane-associated protein [Paraburkholderia sp. Cpub6]MBB5468955.1 membrane-associated protein [Paraburkholderia sp. CI2]
MNLMNVLQIALHLDQHLSALIVQFGTAIYALLFVVVFVEYGFLPLFFLPGDPLIFICGALAATGALNVWIIAPVLFVATVAGSSVGYAIGHAVGDKVYTRNYYWLNRDALRRAHVFSETRGRLTFLLSPYIAVVRTFAPFAAGVSRMTFSRFVTFVTAGAALWVVSLIAGGYLFGNVPVVREHLSSLVLLGLALGGAMLVGGAVWRFFNRRVRAR